MPTYDYHCIQCGYRYEKFQSITSDSEEVCPQCGGEISRIITGGSGFLMKSTSPCASGNCGVKEACAERGGCASMPGGCCPMA